MSRPTSHKQQPIWRPALILAVALVGILASVLMVTLARIPPAPPATARHFVEVASPGNDESAALRTVVIAGNGEVLPYTSGMNGMLMTNLVAGQLPAEATRAIVRSDSNCQPDQEGVSHCLNELEIGSTRVVVRHHHKMSEVPCLTPGEMVNLMSIEQFQKL